MQTPRVSQSIIPRILGFLVGLLVALLLVQFVLIALASRSAAGAASSGAEFVMLYDTDPVDGKNRALEVANSLSALKTPEARVIVDRHVVRVVVTGSALKLIPIDTSVSATSSRPYSRRSN